MERGQHEVGIRLVKVYDSTTICANALITYCVTATVPAPNVIAKDEFVPGMFQRHLVPQNRY
jgi:hypothetical protein